MKARNAVDRLRAANPVSAPIAHTQALRDLMRDVQVRIVTDPATREQEDRRRNRFRLATRRHTAVVFAVAVLAVGGVAAAATILTTTRVGAAGFCQSAERATASIPYPAGYQAWRNWQLLISVGAKLGTTLHQVCDPPAGAHIADAGYPGTFYVPVVTQDNEGVRSAFCAWTQVWLTARENNHAAEAERASTEIEGALEWPQARAADPHPSNSAHTSSPLGWLLLGQRAVEANNIAKAMYLFNDGNTTHYPGGECSLFVPPHGSHNGTVLGPLVS